MRNFNNHYVFIYTIITLMIFFQQNMLVIGTYSLNCHLRLPMREPVLGHAPAPTFGHKRDIPLLHLGARLGLGSNTFNRNRSSQMSIVTNQFDDLLRRHITTITTALWLVAAVTGVILFFHLARGSIETIHEWVGMLFITAAVLHVVRHRASFANLLRQPRTHLLFAAVAAGIATFVLALPAERPGNPMHQLAQAAEKAPLAHLAPVLGINDQTLLNRLRAGGIAVNDPVLSLADIAAAHHVETSRLLALALGSRKAEN